MNINTICHHPAEAEASAALFNEQDTTETFTLAHRTAERMARARKGLVHVMTDILPDMEAGQATEAYCWLYKILELIEMTEIDAEESA
ncbi:nicotinic acetylcholine receptor subunit beta [Phytobacter diazotrophicus]|uniref:nicotinic acetylcholine receptor subunit beta n=1 Tax=Phytobacter diazotrophicus TaxID=395631 RepID=UPI002FFCC4CA